MKKRIISLVVILIAVVSCFSLTGCGKKTKTVESFPEKVAKLNSYKITGKLYTIFPSGTKECLITSYARKDLRTRVTNIWVQLVHRSFLKSWDLLFTAMVLRKRNSRYISMNSGRKRKHGR